MKKRNSKVNQKEGDGQLFAFLATFLSILGFIIAFITRRKDKYVMFYAEQSLVVFVLAVLVGAVNSFLVWIPILGWMIMSVLNLIVVILWIFSWAYALSGSMKEVPLVGKYGRLINLA
jgi:uncharacterized membrane protein